MNIGTVEGLLKLRDEFTGVLTRASSQLEQHGKRMEKVGRRMSEAGGQLTRAITLPLAALGGASVKAFADFDAALNQSLAIMGDVSDSLRDEMAGAAREMAKETVFSAKQAAESYFFLASAGLDAESSIAALPTVAKFAQAGMFDMALATDLLTDAQSALGLTIRDDAVANMKNMIRVSDVLVKSNTLANATVEQFSTALTSGAGAAAKAFNVSLEDTVATLAVYADQGIKAELAGNSFARTLRLLIPAAIDNADEFRRLGVEVFDAAGNLLPMADIVASLTRALGDLSPRQKSAELTALGFQKRMQQVILPLLGADEALRGYREQLDRAGGITEEVSNNQLKAFSKRMGLLKDRIVDVFITLGGSLAPLLTDFADRVVDPLVGKLARLAEGFAKLPAPIRAAAAGVLTLIAAVGPVLLIGGALTSAWGAVAAAAPAVLAALTRVLAVITGPAGWIAAAAATLLAWKPVRDFLIDFGRRAFAPLQEWIGVAIEFVGRLWDALRPARQVLGEVIGFFVKLAGIVADAARVVRDRLLEVFRELFEDTRIGSWRDLLSNALETIVQWVDRASRAFLAWWDRTAEGRRFLLELARVAAVDVAEAVGSLIRFIANYITHTAEAIKETGRWALKFLDWIGVMDVVHAGVQLFVAGVRLMLEWMREAITRITEWVMESDGLLRVIAALDPAMGLLIGKIREWAGEAEKNLRKPMKKGSEATEELGGWLSRLKEKLSELFGGAGDAGDGLGEMSDALKDALKSIADTTAEQEALLTALAESQEAYDVLNTLLDQGVPLADALTGAHDDLARAYLEVTEKLENLIAERERANRLTEEATKLEKELAKAIQDAIDASASGEVRSGPQFPILGVPEGITDEYLEILGAVERIRREEEKRAQLLAEIRRQLEAGLITQEEARAITEQMNIETNAMAEALETMMKRAWENIQDAAAGAIAGIFKDLIKTGNSAIDRLLGSFIDMLAELLVVWAANAAKRALLERSVGAASGVSGGGGGGGGFGWLGALKSLFGFGGGGAVASTSTATATGITGVVGTGSSATGASVAGLSSTAVAVMGTAAVAAAVYVLADRYVKNQKSGKTAGTVQFGGGEGIQAFSGQKALNDAMVQAAKELQEAFRQFEVLTGATIGTLEKVTINVKNSGKIWVTIGDLLTASFDNMEEAVGFAIRESLRNAEHIGLSPAAQAALAHSAAKTLDQLNDDLAFAIAAEEKVMGREGRAAARQWVDGYIKDFEREISLGLVEALGGQSAALMNMVDDLVGAFNAFKGIEQDPAERVRAEAEALKARAEIAQAMLLATRAEIIAKQAELEASGALAAGHGATAIAISESAAAAVLAGSALSDAMVNQAQVAATSAEAIALANAAALAAIDKALEAIAALELTQADIDKAVARARAAASKGGASPMEQLRKTLEQMEFDRLLQGMTELEAGLATLDRQYEEQKKLAQGNVELLALLNAEYAKQEELLRKQVQLNAVDTFRNFMGIGADPFSQLGKGFEDAKSAVEEAGFGAERTARMVDRLTASYQHQLDQLSQQEFVAIGDGLMGILETYYGGVEGFEEFRVKLEQFRFDLELANLRLRFEILKAEGSLAEAVLARAQEVFDFIDANPIDWDNFIAPSAPRFQQASRGINNALEEMVRRLESAKEGIRDFLLSLQRGAFGGRSNEEMFNAAFRQFQELASQPGNIQAQENFPEVARNLLEIARERFGSTAEFQNILDMVEAAGLDFLDVTRVTEDNVVFDQRFLDAQRVQLDVDRKGYDRVVQATQDGFLMMSAAENQSRDEIVAEIRGLRESQNLLNKRLQAIESRRRTEKVA